MLNHHLTIASTAHAQLVALDATTAAALIHAHGQMLQAIAPALNGLYTWIAEKRQEDDEETLPFTGYHAQMQAVKRAITIQAGYFASLAQSIIGKAQHQAIDLGLTSSHAHLTHINRETVWTLLNAYSFDPTQKSLPRFDVPPIRLPSPVVLAQHADVLQPASARGQLFAQLAPEATKQAMSALRAGIATNQSSSAIAASVGNALKTILHRAIVIASTAIASAYRGAVHTLTGTNANDKVLGWYWVADLAGNVCLACLYMHGSKHPNSEVMGSHPRCHCQQIPFTKDTPPMQSGSEWLAQQPEDVQKATFDSDALYALYKAGTPLSAFVGRESDPIWGSSIFVKPLKDISK